MAALRVRFLVSSIRSLSSQVAKPINKDVYGPPDPKSSLRLVTFYRPPDETPQQKEYRLQRAQVQDWNQEFWTAHNLQFNKAKEEFITKFMEKRGTGSSEPLTADDLSEFYRQFLNENREKHFRYNIEWHKKNIKLLWPGIKANWSKISKIF